MSVPVTARVVSAVKGIMTGGDAIVEVTATDPEAPVRLQLDGFAVRNVSRSVRQFLMRI
jgi:hypothetical protein